jgi:hypothetical protein
MATDLLLVERAVLESLAGGSKNLLALHEDTGLSMGPLNNIVGHLLHKKLIQSKQNDFSLDWNKWQLLSQELQSYQNVKEEIKESLIGLVDCATFDQPKDFPIVYKKVWLDPVEKKCFNSLAKELNGLLENAQKKKTEKNILGQQELVFFAHASYGAVIQEVIG